MGWTRTGDSAPSPEAGFVRVHRLSAHGKVYLGLQIGGLFLLKENCKRYNLNKERKLQFNNHNTSSFLHRCHFKLLSENI